MASRKLKAMLEEPRTTTQPTQRLLFPLHPLEQAVQDQIAALKAQIAAKQKELAALTSDLDSARFEVFEKKYGVSAKRVIDDYKTVMRTCLVQGGVGYEVWVPGVVHSGSHMLIDSDKYQRCLPTDQEKEAFYAVYGKEMQVTTKKHTERVEPTN